MNRIRIRKIFSNHAVDITSDGVMGWEYSETSDYDLILLDWMLPKLDGIQICKRLRLQGSQALILMLTARDTTIDKVTNAIYHTAPNGMITIEAERDKTDCMVCIQDTGIGIAPENIERIFDRFWRADSSRSHWDNGSGLGLAIVRSIWL